jgi:predicted dehydrogenase
VRLEAVCDASAERLAVVAGAAAGARTYTDHRDLLAREDLDAVTVSSPHGLHFRHVQDALDRNLHVLVDKPFVLRTAEAEALIDHAAARGRVLMVALNRHLDPANLYAREQIRSGALGAVGFVRSLQLGYVAERFYVDPALSGGGPLVGRGTHMAALIPWLTGWRPRAVTAVFAARGGPVDAGGAVSVDFGDGALAQIAALAGGQRNVDEVAVYGADGAVVVERVPGRPGWIVRPEGAAEPVAAGALPAGQTTTDHFVDVALGRTPARIPLEDALAAVQIVEAAYASRQTGRTATIPPSARGRPDATASPERRIG